MDGWMEISILPFQITTLKSSFNKLSLTSFPYKKKQEIQNDETMIKWLKKKN